AVPSKVMQRNFYLLDEEKNGLEYNYYEGNWQNVPDFNSLTKIRNGHIYDFNLDSFERRSAKFAVEFNGYLKIEEEGEYSFYTVSNDGSKLFINNTLIVNNDGVHGNFERQGKIVLKPGMHQIKVQYFDAGGSQSLKVLYKAPGGIRQAIPLEKLFIRKK
ncbi:MAG: PA14 domain-containing protein, partial [Melioribacteraceae bacterium]